jgi:very-short-patch-repair endonuclease
VPRLDRAGKRRRTDCEWVLSDGTVLVLEVDGAFHMEVMQWGADIKRARAITTRERIVVRCTSFELRHEMDEVARDLLALGVPRAA